MQIVTSEQDSQIRAATRILHRMFTNSLLAVYLHGSAVSGGLRPHSDIDLLVVIDRPMTDAERSDLLTALLGISSRYPATPGAERCLEVIVFARSKLSEYAFPAEAEFVYGEWLRDAYEAGATPMQAIDPENTLILAQARQQSHPLLGPKASDLLPQIPLTQVHHAMRDALPPLLGGLHGDERNVLLTLARMWRTAEMGDFVGKDEAAAWVVPQLPNREAETVELARRAYLGEIADDWEGRQDSARQAAEYLHERVSELL